MSSIGCGVAKGFRCTMLLLALALAGGGCAAVKSELGAGSQTWTMNTSDKLPAASGRLSVRKDSDGNQVVDVKFEHLAPASRAFPGSAEYMLWVVPKGGSPQNMGIVNVGDDLSANLSTKTPYQDFEVVVTAEAVGNPTVPSANRAFAATVHVPA